MVLDVVIELLTGGEDILCLDSDRTGWRVGVESDHHGGVGPVGDDGVDVAVFEPGDVCRGGCGVRKLGGDGVEDALGVHAEG